MKKYILGFCLFLLSSVVLVQAQNGLERILVEKYYISDANDSLGKAIDDENADTVQFKVTEGGALTVAKDANSAGANILIASATTEQEIAKFKFVPKNTDNSYLGFFISQSKNYLNVFIIIFALLVFMEILKKVGLISLINKMLRPLLKPLGIGENAITINLVSLTMGISYGAALFFEEIKSGKITKQELTNSIYLKI